MGNRTISLAKPHENEHQITRILRNELHGIHIDKVHFAELDDDVSLSHFSVPRSPWTDWGRNQWLRKFDQALALRPYGAQPQLPHVHTQPIKPNFEGTSYTTVYMNAHFSKLSLCVPTSEAPNLASQLQRAIDTY